MNILSQLQVIREVLEDFKADKLVSEERVDGALGQLISVQCRLSDIRGQI